MRISDWSSDVCSSDLDRGGGFGEIAGAQLRARLLQQFAQRILAPLQRTGVLRLQRQDALVQRQCGLVVAGQLPRLARGFGLRKQSGEIGSASWRERVCHSVYL